MVALHEIEAARLAATRRRELEPRQDVTSNKRGIIGYLGDPEIARRIARAAA